MAKILVTGSTGYIGKRLVHQLLEQGDEVYALSRIKGIEPRVSGSFHILYGDLRDPERMAAFPKEIDAAYYLVHSMGHFVENLREEEEAIAKNFISAIEKTNCKQILFLGGIVENEKELSAHLRSRLAVEKVLKSGRIPCTILRSSIIIGSGSASFEIIRDLAEKLPIMVAPKWVKTMCQPIAISDVLFYLKACLLNEASYGKTYDIGGPEAISFKEVLLRYAKFRQLKRKIFDVPVLSPRLSSYWLVLITSVRFSICHYLVESMRQPSRKLNQAIDALVPHRCLRYEEALKLSFQKIAQNEVVSKWSDAWDIKRVNASLQDFVEVPKEGCLKDVQVVSFTLPVEEIQRRVWSIGGETGWYSMNAAWKFRGLIDQLVGGAGLRRGRLHPTELAVGDAIDFWRVLLANKKEKHLILYAEMKLPGEAWLEFEINDVDKTLKQTATFRPKGFLGRLYWYLLLPFHLLVFKKMAKSIAEK